MSRRGKLDWLTQGAEAGRLAGEISVERDWLDDMRPRPFLNGELLSIDSCFKFKSSGVETTRDHLAYGFDPAAVTKAIETFRQMNDGPAMQLYSQTRKASFSLAHSAEFDPAKVVAVGYRPLDRRSLYNAVGFVDWPRPALQKVWGARNVGLFAMPVGTNLGPAAWCHGLLPDRHAFRGSYGGYAFPLFDRREGFGPYNLEARLVAGLGAAYGEGVTPEAVFDAILCLLSASSYTTRFAEDLEDVFPHIPFPKDHMVFEWAARLGAEIRAVETFARLPGELYRQGLARAETEPTGPLAGVEWTDGEIRLCANGSGRIVNIPSPVWEFAVSGYRLLPRWLAAREGLAIGPNLIPELRDVAARIAELIDLFEAADSILEGTLADSLGRAALGFDDLEADPGDD